MTRMGLIASKRYGVHPKHLIDIGVPWYLEYISQDDTVVDLGCGTGIHCDRIKMHGADVIGFDKNDANGLYTDLEWCVPLPDNFADVVLLSNVLEHIENRKFLFNNIRRILKPDGFLMLSVPNSDTRPKRFRKRMGFDPRADKDHKIEYTFGSILKELDDNGFGHIIDLRPIVIDTFWAGAIDLLGLFHLGVYAHFARWKRNQVFKHPDETTGWRIVCRKK